VWLEHLPSKRKALCSQEKRKKRKRKKEVTLAFHRLTPHYGLVNDDSISGVL
jgi:hypothetical protein